MEKLAEILHELISAVPLGDNRRGELRALVDAITGVTPEAPASGPAKA